MTYWHTPTNTVRSPGALETKLSDGAKLGAPDGRWTDELAALCGFVRVTETDPPVVTSGQVAESTVQLVNGVPTRTWTVRAKTADELAADTQQANTQTLEGRVPSHITALQTIRANGGAADKAIASALLDLMRVVHRRLDAVD